MNMKVVYKKKDVFIQSVMDKRRLCLPRAPNKRCTTL